MPDPAASAQAAKIAQLQGGSRNIVTIPQFIRADFASATRDVLYGMTIVMAVAAVVALRGLRSGVQEDTSTAKAGLSDQLPEESAGVTHDRLAPDPGQASDESS